MSEGLSDRQTVVLSVLDELDLPLTTRAVADSAGMTTAAARSALLALKGKGLVRAVDVRWALTEAGHDA